MSKITNPLKRLTKYLCRYMAGIYSNIQSDSYVVGIDIQ